MVNLHTIDGIPLQDLRVMNKATGNIIGCVSTRSAALGIQNRDIQAWYSCNGYLSEEAHICASGPSYLTKYFKAAKEMAPLAYSFSYEDALTSVGSYACPKATNYIVTIGNPNNPNSCPNIGQVPPPPVTTKCQTPELATFKTTKNQFDGSSITINWSTPTGSSVTSYKIFDYRGIQIGETTTPSFTDGTTPPLTVGQQATYAYQVQSVCSGDGSSSDKSAVYSAKVTGELAPSCITPDLTTFATTKNVYDGSSITINWATPAGGNVTSYKIFNWVGQLISETTTPSFTDDTTPHLDVGQQGAYKYQVQSICANSGLVSEKTALYPAIVTGEAAAKCMAPDITAFRVTKNIPDASLIRLSWAVPTRSKPIVGYTVLDWQMKPLRDGNVIAPFYENQTQYSLPHLARNQVGNYWYFVQSKCNDGSVSDISQKYIATVSGS
jgi:hypothetical protein